VAIEVEFSEEPSAAIFAEKSLSSSMDFNVLV